MADPFPSDPNDSRPEPKDLSHHLSRVTKAREPSAIKSFYKYFQIPGIGQVAGGLPNNYYFPFDTLEAKVARPERWEPTPNDPVDPPPGDDVDVAAEAMAGLGVKEKEKDVKKASSPLNQPQDALTVPHTSAQRDPLKKIDLASALQYGTAQGYPPLYYFVREFTQKHLHPNCPYKGGPEVILTVGNTDGWNKVLTALTNEWSEEKDWIRDKDGLLVEYFAYTNAIQNARPRGLNIVPVAIDDEGMVAEGEGGLRDVLENWDFKRGRRPRLMYTVTMGQNPTSGVLSLSRRRALYDLCCKYDIIIVEDDPYWYLQYPTATSQNTTTTSDPSNVSFNPDVKVFANGEPHPENWKSSGYEYLDSIVPSSIQIDTEGRVIRLDTFSKTVAPGCRLGWLSAQPELIKRIMLVTETGTQQPSGFVQGVIAELLLGPEHNGVKAGKEKGGLSDGKGWKMDGWVRWLEGLRGNYERRMNLMARTLEEGAFLVKTGRRGSLAREEERDEWSVVEKTRVLSFDWPVGGMFLWLRIHFSSHPLFSHYTTHSHPSRLSRALWIFWTTKPYRVLVSPGTMFSPSREISERDGWKFFRLCFAAIDAEDVVPISERIAEGVRGFFKIKSVGEIEKLLEEDEKETETEVGAGGREGLVGLVGMC